MTHYHVYKQDEKWPEFHTKFSFFLVCKTLLLFFRTTTTSHGAIPG